MSVYRVLAGDGAFERYGDDKLFKIRMKMANIGLFYSQAQIMGIINHKRTRCNMQPILEKHRISKIVSNVIKTGNIKRYY